MTTTSKILDGIWKSICTIGGIIFALFLISSICGPTSNLEVDATEIAEYRQEYPPVHKTSLPTLSPTTKWRSPTAIPSTPTCISWNSAARYIGKLRCICGKVSHTKQNETTFFIHYDQTKTSFYGYSYEYYWPKGTLENVQCLRICGLIEENYGRPRIHITDPDQLSDCLSTQTKSSIPTNIPTKPPTQKQAPKATNTANPPPCSCAGNLYNCKDFSSHAQAQKCFRHCLSLGYGDIHLLDSDLDGIACELLP